MMKDWQKREYVLDILGRPSLAGSDKNCLIHLVGVLEQRGGIEKCRDYEMLFRMSTLSPIKLTITKFYYWTKENEFSADDILMYKVFSQLAKENGVEKVLSTPFASNGACLHLREWIKDAGNKFEIVCEDYCKVIIKEAVGWNKSLLQRPKSLLADYGITIWSKWLEQHGGEKSYLLPNNKEKEKAEKIRDGLEEMEKIRAEFLQKGDLEAFDYIGKMIAERSYQ